MIDDVASWYDGCALISMVSNKLVSLITASSSKSVDSFPGVYCSTVGLRHDDLLSVYRAGCELVCCVPCLQNLHCQNRYCGKALAPVAGYRASQPIYCIYCYRALLRTVGILLLPTLLLFQSVLHVSCLSQSAAHYARTVDY
jgi:hypothetical protein